MTLDLPNLAATNAFGRRLGAVLEAGAVVGLVGEMGAGKTHLTRAICEGLGLLNSAAVTSPTFVLIQEYEGRLPIFHFDTYRLRSPREFAELGAAEYLDGAGVCLIEWADRVVEFLPPDRLTVTLSHIDETTRRAVVTAGGPRHAAMLERLAASCKRAESVSAGASS